MKNIERIIRYIEHDLPEQDRKRFEDDLQRNQLLKQEYNAFLNSLHVMTPPLSPEDEGSSYFATSVVRMRANISEKRYGFLTRPAFASLASALLVLSLVFLINGIQNPTPQSGFFSESDRRELETMLAGDEDEASQLNSSLLPPLAGERTMMDEDDYSALETEIASSIAPTEEERIAMLNEVATSEDLLANLSDEEVDELLNALTIENE